MSARGPETAGSALPSSMRMCTSGTRSRWTSLRQAISRALVTPPDGLKHRILRETPETHACRRHDGKYHDDDRRRGRRFCGLQGRRCRRGPGPFRGFVRKCMPCGNIRARGRRVHCGRDWYQQCQGCALDRSDRSPGREPQGNLSHSMQARRDALDVDSSPRIRP